METHTFSDSLLLTLSLFSLLCLRHALVTACQVPGCMCEKQGITYSVACFDQRLTRLPASIPATTSLLQLEGNEFGVIRRANFSAVYLQLRRLSLNNSGVTDVMNGTFHGLMELNEIDLRHNRLHVIRAHAFSGLPGLRALRLDHNELTTLNDFAFSGIGDAFEGVRLSLAMNTELNVMRANAFTDAPISELLLANSSLTSETLTAIKHLRDTLVFLYLKNNRLKLEIPADLFQGFHLHILDLSNNGISNLDFLQHLQVDAELSLAGNPIGATNFSASPLLRNLRSLTLDRCNVTTLDRSHFAALHALQELSLSDNRIHSISRAMRGIFQQLQRRLSLDGNPLHCNCDLKWLHSFSKRHRRGYSTGARCVTPRATRVFSMTSSDFVCHEPTDVVISHITMSSGQSALLCNVTSDPFAAIRWTLPDSSVIQVAPPPTQRYVPGRVQMTQATLVFDKNYTSGYYVCEASNHLGSDSNRLYVDVYRLIRTQTSSAGGGDDVMDSGTDAAIVRQFTNCSLIPYLVFILSAFCL